ncbi:CehA/McbA family metallohydrolase [Paenibacillus sp. S28]|uniref:CehA/McbA family metallohydrolase n=1 Tax=Paenibacillus sp. S28 TaxID=2767463 RepID=UPI00190B116B|nr:CehA/McbA family metallohydrolase [Paenibacillus sp. S28]MBJ9987800.1 PHP domain-containing protein [Paenibacillus sp. S28]
MQAHVNETESLPVITIGRQVNISPDEEKTYLEVRFHVPADAGRIHVAYQYDRADGKTVIDLGLRSPERIVGWSGGARTEMFVGLETATPGYASGDIASGEWAVLLGAYKVPDEGTEVSVSIEIQLKHKRWIPGDLHAHTFYSDGKHSVGEVSRSCLDKGLAFLAMTDHNTFSQNRNTLAKTEELLLIPGVEMTNYKGHANLLGQLDPLEDFRVYTVEQASEQLAKGREKGALAVLNHPFCPDCPWEFGFDVPFDAIEVWNGPWRELNETAVRWWQERLAEGRRIVAVGGSDFHGPHPWVQHGRPTAHVRSESLTAAGILEGIRRGNVVLTLDPDSTFIDFQIHGACAGDQVLRNSEHGTVVLEAVIRRAQGDQISLWSDRGLERQWTAANDELTLTCELPQDRLFYRMEARRDMGELGAQVMTCLTNPVYFIE